MKLNKKEKINKGKKENRFEEFLTKDTKTYKMQHITIYSRKEIHYNTHHFLKAGSFQKISHFKPCHLITVDTFFNLNFLRF